MANGRLYFSYVIYGFIIILFAMTALYSSTKLISSGENRQDISHSRDYSILELSNSFNDFNATLHKFDNQHHEIDEKDVYYKFKYMKSIHISALYTNEAYSKEDYSTEIIKKLHEIGTKIEFIGRHIENFKDNKNLIIKEAYKINDLLSNLSSYNLLSKRSYLNSEEIETQKKYLVYSVLIMGLSGLVLIMILINKVNNVKKLGAEKQEILDVMHSRLNAIDASGEGIVAIDKNGNIHFINETLKEMHGLDIEDAELLIGDNWLNLYPYIDEKTIKDLGIGKKIISETEIYTDKGKIMPVEISATKTEDEGLIIIIRDIRERKRLDKEKDDLQNQFSQSQKMEAIGRLAGGIAHDFNNILASMLGYAEFLEEDLEGDKKKQNYAKKILQGGMQARQLVDQILAFSRRSETIRTVINVGDVIKEAISMLRSTLPRSIEMKFDVGYNKAMILANENQLMQILMNLCVNAKDAMENNEGILEINLNEATKEELRKYFPKAEGDLPDLKNTPKTRISEISKNHAIMVMGDISKNHNYIKISIKDTGSGMPIEVMEHVFEPFYTTKPKGKGTGLGLSTTHGAISSHQGAMVIDSKLGKGTSFKIYLPVNEKIDVSEGLSIKKMDKEELKIKDDYKGARILVVDDQEDVAEIMEKMIARLGYNVCSINSPLEALDLIREKGGAFDLIVSDYTMPDMTGIDMAEEIYNDFPDIPVMIVTGYKKSKLQELAHTYPSIQKIISKPANSRKLHDSIYEILKNQKNSDGNIVSFPKKNKA